MRVDIAISVKPTKFQEDARIGRNHAHEVMAAVSLAVQGVMMGFGYDPNKINVDETMSVVVTID